MIVTYEDSIKSRPMNKKPENTRGVVNSKSKQTLSEKVRK